MGDAGLTVRSQSLPFIDGTLGNFIMVLCDLEQDAKVILASKPSLLICKNGHNTTYLNSYYTKNELMSGTDNSWHDAWHRRGSIYHGSH